MAVATYTKFDKFPLALTEKKHNLTTDQLMIALTNTAPNASTAGVLADLTEVSYTNLSSRVVTTTSNTQTAGVQKLVCADLTITAGPAAGPAMRYAVLYNNTATNKDLIGFWDYGVSFTPGIGETFLVDFDGTAGVFTTT